MTPEERFWAKVRKEPGDGCWVWIGAKSNGYASDRRVYAHHIAWKLSGRELAKGQFLKRTCGNKLCVRLEHIYLSASNAREARPAPVRFWEKVDKNGPLHPLLRTVCWLWKGKTMEGYGTLGVGHDGSVLAHRFSWELAAGPIESGACVLHRCDNRRCVRPDHLFLGTRQQNTADMLEKQRHLRIGEDWRRGYAKLSDDQVREIRRRYSKYARVESSAELAREFGVSRCTIIGVAKGDTHRHVK